MSHLKLTPFISLLLLTASCSMLHHAHKSPVAMAGTWQQQPIVIDGDSKDWPSPYPNYDAKARVAYATSNDMENLYITMETGDEMTQLKILKQGFIVSIDTGGRKMQEFKINFPLQSEVGLEDMPHPEQGVKKEGARYQDRQRQQRISGYAREANQLSLEGFANCTGGYTLKQTIPCGIKVSTRLDEYNELVWEAVVPFKAIYNKDKITAADFGRPISVCFAVKGFKRTEPKNNGGGDNNSGGGGMNTGMGTAGANSSMHGGGGKGGGRGGQTESPLQHLYENTKTWKHFGIAYP
jgi:hypothetical protein